MMGSMPMTSMTFYIIFSLNLNTFTISIWARTALKGRARKTV